MFGFPEFEVLDGVVVVESVGRASAAAARSAKKRSNSDDVKDSWSPCTAGYNIPYDTISILYYCKMIIILLFYDVELRKYLYIKRFLFSPVPNPLKHFTKIKRF